MLADHVSAGVAHLFSDPVDRCDSAAEQLAGIGMPALARPAIPHPSMLQVRLEETIADTEVVDVRLASGGIEEDEMQLVLPYGSIVSLHHVDRMRLRLGR